MPPGHHLISHVQPFGDDLPPSARAAAAGRFIAGAGASPSLVPSSEADAAAWRFIAVAGRFLAGPAFADVPLSPLTTFPSLSSSVPNLSNLSAVILLSPLRLATPAGEIDGAADEGGSDFAVTTGSIFKNTGSAFTIAGVASTLEFDPL